MHLKRTFLIGVIIAFCLAAVLGIWVLLFEHFFGIEEEVFATLGSVILFCLPALTCAALVEKRHWTALMTGTMVFCIAGLVFYLMIIWFHEWLRRWIAGNDDWMWKTMGFFAWWGVGLPWTGMLSLRKFRTGWMRWVQRAAMGAVMLLALVLTIAVFTEFDYDEITWKAIGTTAILAALGTVTVPILAKIEGIDKIASTESTALDVRLTCPRCQLAQTVQSGRSRCRQCRLRFFIEIEEPRCPQCNYLLHHLTRPVCPECGAMLGADELPESAGAVTS